MTQYITTSSFPHSLCGSSCSVENFICKKKEKKEKKEKIVIGQLIPMHDGAIGAWEVRRHLPNIQGPHGLTCMDTRDGSRDYGKWGGGPLYQSILLYRGGSRVFNWGEERQW